jgi:hypothetical protein
MKDFIVYVSGGGQERWITVNASDQDDARLRVRLAGTGWIAVGVYDTIADAREAASTNPDLLSQIDVAEAQGFQSLGTLPSANRPEIEAGSGDEPFLPEKLSGASVAFDRALQSIGYDRGVLGTIGQSKFADLNALAMLGRAGKRDTEMFQDLGQGREMQDFFSKALGRLSGGRDPGATATFDLPSEAAALFNLDVDPSSKLFNFFNPKIGMGRGDAGVGEQLSGYDAALLSAQLGLAGIGAQRFGGAFSSMLPSAQTLVSGFQSQPTGGATAQSDIRAYIRDRLNA